MKRLIMCEGSNELEIMKILLENDALIFTEDDLLGLTPYHATETGHTPIGDSQYQMNGQV